MLSDFRAVSRRESYRFRPARLGELIEDWIEVERVGCNKLGIELATQIPPELPEVVVDRDKFKQVLLNLCKNAILGLTVVRQIVSAHAGSATYPDFADSEFLRRQNKFLVSASS